MAKLVCHSHLLLLIIVFLSLHPSSQLQQNTQSQTLLKIQQLLNYPSALTSFSHRSNIRDFCKIEPTPSLTLSCYEGNVTQLHIIGNNGFPPLPRDFSADYFFATLVGLPSLKVLSLVSLGLWGPMPASIGHLSSLEILNVSTNYLSGTVPLQLSYLRNLQTLILNHNKFTGQVPGWLSSLPVLAVLSLKNNMLNGSLPYSLASLQTLRVLCLSSNFLSGEVPDLRNLTNLQVLDLEENYFGPHFPSMPSKLVTLVLRKNKFRLGIQTALGSCYQLQKLDISLNGFVGPFLSSWDLPTCLKRDSKSRVVLYSGNCLVNEDQKQHPSYLCHNEALVVRIPPPSEEKHRRTYGKHVVASSAVGGIVGAIAVVGLAFMAAKKFYSEHTTKTPQTRIYISDTMKLGASLPAYRTFALEELQEATHNFDDSTLLGEGSHGQIYRGKLPDGTFVAIRGLKMRKRQSPQVYTHLLEQISKLRHSHLVSALGHCLECHPDDSGVSRVFLIHAIQIAMEKGPPGRKLTWPQRIIAAIGVAKGIQFLHTGIVPGVKSNNLRIKNVLLDHNLHVKISSYNLPLLAESRGTMGTTVSSPAPKGSVQARY
ncbi:unnamed protein product [Prunus armeniaca]|uniref:Protein kinase domain-containing protein n=1 Tax=Prunus armeniaca TaxID=36596 RepID=A0A6J5TMB9_PRUAR|nr:unnamed protein product [Prunus armeniaca]